MVGRTAARAPARADNKGVALLLEALNSDDETRLFAAFSVKVRQQTASLRAKTSLDAITRAASARNYLHA